MKRWIRRNLNFAILFHPSPSYSSSHISQSWNNLKSIKSFEKQRIDSFCFLLSLFFFTLHSAFSYHYSSLLFILFSLTTILLHSSFCFLLPLFFFTLHSVFSYHYSSLLFILFSPTTILLYSSFCFLLPLFFFTLHSVLLPLIFFTLHSVFMPLFFITINSAFFYHYSSLLFIPISPTTILLYSSFCFLLSLFFFFNLHFCFLLPLFFFTLHSVFSYHYSSLRFILVSPTGILLYSLFGSSILFILLSSTTILLYSSFCFLLPLFFFAIHSAFFYHYSSLLFILLSSTFILLNSSFSFLLPLFFFTLHSAFPLPMFFFTLHSAFPLPMFFFTLHSAFSYHYPSSLLFTFLHFLWNCYLSIFLFHPLLCSYSSYSRLFSSFFPPTIYSSFNLVLSLLSFL